MFDSTVAEKQYLTPSELALMWNCSAHHIRNLIRSGQLRGFRVGTKMIVNARDAQTYLERSATATPQAA